MPVVLSCSIINNLLRTIRHGQEVKNAVDEAITACSQAYDLLESIEDARQAAEDVTDNPDLRQQKVAKGLNHLRSVSSPDD